MSRAECDSSQVCYLGGMKERNWGRIVFISSESAVNIPAEMIHYGMTKTAQLAVSRGLAETTAGTGVTVNAVLAGPTRSEGVEQFVEQMASSRPDRPCGSGAGLFQERATQFSAEAVRHTRGSGGARSVCMQPGVVGYERRGLEG